MFRRHGQKPSTVASANSHSSGEIAKVRYAPSRVPSTDSGSLLSRERSHQFNSWWTSCAHLITWIEDPDHNVDAESHVKVPTAVRTAYSQMTASPETRQDVYARYQVITIRAFLKTYQLDEEPALYPLKEMLTLAEEVKNKYCYRADNLDYEQSQMEDPTDSHEYPESQDGDLPDFEQVQHQADELYLEFQSNSSRWPTLALLGRTGTVDSGKPIGRPSSTKNMLCSNRQTGR